MVDSRPKYLDVTPATRRRMQAVGRKDTPPEMRVRRALHAMGYRYRVNDRKILGTPDIVLSRHRKIIFVHGCFWHGHKGCARAKIPKKNADVWTEKITSNQLRDGRNLSTLQDQGWKVLVVWECETQIEHALTSKLKNFLGCL